MIILRALLLGLILSLVYLKGFKDCMFGYREELFDSIRKRHIENGGEDIWSDD